ncbi:ThiF family adenylyltransferase [Cellulomonas iranensis]|uniref:ThiF family adenylyltransferase n=1 Tax=Cellulomonas iranensis TaxID=76862 RepID=UPI001CF3A880|nr:ThiF family adenylyltransferase [Cellulomonas iranensis]UCN14441.1 ThiF family adenylyltransferase [Cellulomonas iranensis]
MARPGALVALTREAIEKMANSPAVGGDLTFTHSPADDIYVASAVESVNGNLLPVTDLRAFSALARADRSVRGQWLRDVPLAVHLAHFDMSRRPGSALPLAKFQEIAGGARAPRGNAYLLVTQVANVPTELADLGVPTYAGWSVDDVGAQPLAVEIEPEVTGIGRLALQWPVADLQARRVILAGAGSIGGAVGESLAAYGVGRLDLVDPDRLLWHNLVRHVLGPESVGRTKVSALAEHINARWPQTRAVGHTLDVVEEAHHLRPLLEGADLVVCATDGIAPRRAVSHLARRADLPAVLVCVLDDGGVGEVLRLRPGPRHGCLMCQRRALAEQGAIDAESDQELDYGTGVLHKPMTAVGPDLRLVADLAAKTAVATLLEASGHGDQRLPGEHAVLALRTGNDLAAPYDPPALGMVQWHPAHPPRPGCWTCEP